MKAAREAAAAAREAAAAAREAAAATIVAARAGGLVGGLVGEGNEACVAQRAVGASAGQLSSNCSHLACHRSRSSRALTRMPLRTSFFCALKHLSRSVLCSLHRPVRRPQ